MPSDKWEIEKWSEMFDTLNGGRVQTTDDNLFDFFGFHIPKRFTDEVAWIEYLLFNPNCPERVLGKWLSQAEDAYYEQEDEDENEFGNLLIGNILNLGKQHNKLTEMFHWLQSEDAEKFLLSDIAYEYAAKLILAQIKLLSKSDVDSFTEKYNRPLDLELKLNDSL